MHKLKLFIVIFILFNACNSSKKSFTSFKSSQLEYSQYNTFKQVDDQKTTEETEISVKAKKVNKLPETNITVQKNLYNKPETAVGTYKKEVFSATKKNIQQADNKQKGSKGNNDKLFLFFTALCGFVITAVYFPFASKFKKIAFYAFDNRRKAVYIIAASHIGLGISAFLLGKNLFDLGIRTSEITTNVLSGLVCASVIFYPVRKVKSGFFKPTFLKHKLGTLLILLSGYALMSNIGLQTSQNTNYSPTVAYVSKIYEKSFWNDSKKEPIDKSITEVKKATDDDHGYKVGLSVLLILVALILLFFIFLLACGLACSDMGVLAALVGIGGFMLVIYLTMILWRRIWSY